MQIAKSDLRRYTREGSKASREMVGHCDSLHAREVIRFDHVTVTPVQAASAVATDTPPLPLASQSKLASQRKWAA